MTWEFILLHCSPSTWIRSTPETLWGQLPAGGNIFSHWLSRHSGLEKFFPDLVSDLQVDLERELEHKDVLLTHCMKREADEVIWNLGSSTFTRAEREILFLTQGWTKATGWFVRRQFDEGLRNADSRIRKSGLRFQLYHFWPLCDLNLLSLQKEAYLESGNNSGPFLLFWSIHKIIQVDHQTHSW